MRYLFMVCFLSRQWFTSGRRNTEDSNDFFWEGDGTKVSGTQFWLNDEARADAGTIIVYHSDGLWSN